MTIGPNTETSLHLVRKHNIVPPDCCNECGETSWGPVAVDGTTEATDDGALVWHCNSCNRITAMTAAEIEDAADIFVQRWLIWSNEHGAFWRPGGAGYTRHVDQAGRFMRNEADFIAERAGAHGPGQASNEVVVLAPEHRWHGRG